jgi:uncharacterized membrane protein
LKGRRIKDFAIYALLGVVNVGAIYFFAFAFKPDAGLVAKWHAFTLVTLLVFGQAIHATRARWRRRRLWFVLGALLLAQGILGALVLGALPRVPILYWVLFYPLNYGLVMACIEHVVLSE